MIWEKQLATENTEFTEKNRPISVSSVFSVA